MDLGWLNITLFTMGGVELSLRSLLLSLLVLLVGFSVAKRTRRSMEQRLTPLLGMDKSTAYTVSTLIFYCVIALTLLLSFSMLGFDLTSLAIIAGALSIGIGFGLQDIAKNFISGLLLLFDRSIKVGDFIELANGGLRGTVEQIRVRSTIVRTGDDLDVIVPNSQFLSDQVINWTMSSHYLRLHAPFCVAYGSDVDRLQRVMQELLTTLPGAIVSEEGRTSRLWFTGMGDSSLNFELLVWIQGDDIINHRTTLSRYTYEIHRTLLANGFDIPFPQRDIHIKSMPGPLPERP